MQVKIYSPEGVHPKYSRDGDAGMDIPAAKDYLLAPGETCAIPAGFRVAIPRGYEIQIRPRSGASLNSKLRVANSPGTIDSNYRGEIAVIVDNIGIDQIKIKKGDRIAQMVLKKVEEVEWVVVPAVGDLDETNRGEAGFGSSGV